MKLRQLVCFCKVVDAGSFSSAAEQLNMAQPALGSHIRQLEDGLGAVLFTRHPRGVTPTSAGKLLYGEARRILGDVERLTKQIRQHSAERRIQLRLGACPSVIKVVSPNLLVDTAQSLPHVTISIIEERTAVLLEALAKGQLDIAFVNNVKEHPDLERTAVLEEDLLFVTAPTQCPVPETISLSNALEHDLAIGGPNSVLRRILEAEAQRLSLPLRIAYEIHSLSSIKEMVATGITSSIMSYGIVAQEIRSGKLIGQRIASPGLTRTLYLVRPRENDLFVDEPGIEGFAQNIVDTYLERAGPWASRVA